MPKRALAALFAVAVVLTACSSGEGSGGQLEGSRWVLQSYDVDGTLTIVPETLYADAKFGTNRVSGFAGCNSFDAVYRSGGRTLFITQATTTFMACGEEQNAFEASYLALLDQSRFYTARRATLEIYGAGGKVLLVFDSAPRNPMLGNWEVQSFETAPGSQVAPLEGTTLTAVFGIASVGGEAGCNSYTGTYGTNGSFLRVGPLATTRKACEQPIMDQETAFLAALQGVAKIEQRADTLLLTDRNGNIKVALVRPALEPAASALPSASAGPTPTPTATATASPTPSPTASPTPSPTPAPSPTPTATARRPRLPRQGPRRRRCLHPRPCHRPRRATSSPAGARSPRSRTRPRGPP